MKRNVLKERVIKNNAQVKSTFRLHAQYIFIK